VSRTAHAGFVLDALEQAIHDRRPVNEGGLIHHNDRGSQYLSIKYTERLAEAGIEPFVGSIGDSHDNALAETINGKSRGHSWTRPLVPFRSRRICNTVMGRLVQSQKIAGANRQHTANRS
jgi:transposase InsO family protein